MIRWISEYLGTSPWDATAECSDYQRLDVRDLVDGAGNPIEAVRAKIDEGLDTIRRGNKLVVSCQYGISRSNAIAAGIFAIQENITFHEAVQRVLFVTGEKAVRLEVLAAVREAIGSEFPALVQGERRKSKERCILITGASGFIGSHLLSQLGSELKIVSPTHQDLDLTTDDVLLDLLVKEHGVDTIVHLANPRIYSTVQAMGSTILMLKNVLEICRNNSLKLIYLSSWTVYAGYVSQELRASEALPINPKGIYSETKSLCENLVNSYRHNFGLKCFMLRVSPVYGVGSRQPAFIYTFLEHLLANRTIHTHLYLNGEPKLDLIHVNDVVRAIMSLLQTDFLHSCDFNIGSGSIYSTREIAEILKEICDSLSQIKQHQIDDYVANIVMDAGLARARLGWAPRVNLRDGLRDITESASTRQTKVLNNKGRVNKIKDSDE
jgi:nucleoside-diphosphate-sugar epimerase